jgi:hypothetical protein
LTTFLVSVHLLGFVLGILFSLFSFLFSLFSFLFSLFSFLFSLFSFLFSLFSFLFSGDGPKGWGFDGARKKTWNGDSTGFNWPAQSQTDLGWNIGDVVGLALDVDHGTLRMFKNGKEYPACVGFLVDQGFRSIYGGVMPALTLARGTYRVNFGGGPGTFNKLGVLAASKWWLIGGG